MLQSTGGAGLVEDGVVTAGLVAVVLVAVVFVAVVFVAVVFVTVGVVAVGVVAVDTVVQGKPFHLQTSKFSLNTTGTPFAVGQFITKSFPSRYL